MNEILTTREAAEYLKIHPETLRDYTRRGFIKASRRGKHVKYVFTYLGNRVTQTSTKAWYKALSRAGIKDFRWHDLRHTWASWMVQKGVPLHALQELGGWQSSDMVTKYAHLSSEHLKPYVEK